MSTVPQTTPPPQSPPPTMSIVAVDAMVTIGIASVGAVVFFFLVVAGAWPEYDRCGLICTREWLNNTPQVWLPLLGAIGAIVAMFYDASRGKLPTSPWHFSANTLVGAFSGLMSLFLFQSLAGDTSLAPRNIPWAYLVAMVAGYGGEWLYSFAFDQVRRKGQQLGAREVQEENKNESTSSKPAP